MKALTFSRFGTPDVLEYIDIKKPILKENEILLEMKTIGLNYADIYRRKGNYHLQGKPPYIPGYEGAGIIVQSKSTSYKVGDRIAFADVPYANAQYVVVPQEHAITLPSYITYEIASSLLLQGLTAQYLAQDSFNIKENDLVLIHAAAGGVGQLLTQICKLKKAKVIGLTRDKKKLQTILDSNADYALLLDDTWQEEVMKISNNLGVNVVYDSVGSTLQKSFECTKECGTVVFYGMSAGDPAFIDPRMLMDTSKTLVGGDLWSYLISKEQRQTRANELFTWIKNSDIKLKKAISFTLSSGKDAHIYMEEAKASGKILLIPDFN